MSIRVTVVYALPGEQMIVDLNLPEGARVADALTVSGLQETLPGKSFAGYRCGIWGKPVSPGVELRDRDRVEIYRDIVTDPKQTRRQRAKAQRVPRRRP